MKANRRGNVVFLVLMSSCLALSVMGFCHQASCATTVRVRDALARTQLALLVESGKRIARGPGLTVGLSASGPGWSLDVSAGQAPRLVARVADHLHAE
jgi:hypothetical protein